MRLLEDRIKNCVCLVRRKEATLQNVRENITKKGTHTAVV